MSQELPKFNNPPVIETVLGVEFESLSNFLVPHFGAFLLELKGNYNKFRELPPIPSQIERFEGEPVELASLQIGFHPQIRCLFLNKTEDWRIQIQNNWFLSNWVKTNTKYPSYEETLRRFKTNWNKFRLFLEKSRIDTPQVKQCEVTYNNHIEEFTQVEGLYKVFPFLADYRKKQDFLPSAEGIALRMVYRIPEKRGRLHIEIKPAFRHVDAKNIIEMSLTARVLPKSPDNKDVLEAINIGHEWVVRGFADITSKSMHQVWERS